MKKSQRRVKPDLVAASASPVQFTNVWGYLGLVWAVGTLGIFLNRYPIAWNSLDTVLSALTDFGILHAYMLKILGGFFIGMLLLIIAARVGGLIIQNRIPEPTFSKNELWLLGSALGLGLNAYLVLALGAGHLWYRQVFMAVLVGMGVWSFSIPKKIVADPLFRPSVGTWCWKIILGVLLVLYMLAAASPEIFYDSLHYHLAIPNLYRLEHQIVAVPTMLYADFVMTIQMLYGLAITLGNTLSAKALHVGMALLLGWGYVLFARRFFGTASGWFANVLFFSIPMVYINATTAGTDVGGAFLLFVSAVAVVWALEKRTIELFRLAGALTGIAASTKYPAFVFIPVAGLLISWQLGWDEKKPSREWIPFVLNFGLMAGLFLAPILIKNIVLHKNPLYPFGGTSWGHPRIDPVEWSKFVSDTSSRDWHTTFSSFSSFMQLVFAPWFISMENQVSLGPLLLMGLPFIFKRSLQSMAYRTFQRYALLLWIVWLLTSTVPRYGLPAIVLVCPLIAESVLSAAIHPRVRWILLSAFGIGAFANIALQLMLLFNWEGWQVVAGKISETDYLVHMHASYPTPPYDGLVWMNNQLPKTAVVLFAGESRSYYLERRVIPSSIPGPQPVVLWSHQCKSGAELAQKMRANGVTHIFLNLMEALRTDSYHVFQWDATSWAVFDDFWSHSTRLVWRKENPNRADPEAQYVFEILSDSATLQPHPASANPFDHWKPSVAKASEGKSNAS